MSTRPWASRLFLLINAQATTILVILILFFLVMSFIVSGSRIAFFSLSDKEINILKTKQDSSWRRIVNLLEEPKPAGFLIDREHPAQYRHYHPFKFSDRPGDFL